MPNRTTCVHRTLLSPDEPILLAAPCADDEYREEEYELLSEPFAAELERQLAELESGDAAAAPWDELEQKLRKPQ